MIWPILAGVGTGLLIWVAALHYIICRPARDRARWIEIALSESMQAAQESLAREVTLSKTCRSLEKDRDRLLALVRGPEVLEKSRQTVREILAILDET